MHLLGQGKKGISNIELGRRLGISTNAAWRLQHKLMQAMLERDRRYKLGAAGPRIEIDDAYIGGERTGEGSGRGRRGHTPFIVAIETSDDGRPLHARLQVVRGFRAGETKRLCSGVEAGTTVVSDGGQWFHLHPPPHGRDLGIGACRLISLRASPPNCQECRQGRPPPNSADPDGYPERQVWGMKSGSRREG